MCNFSRYIIDRYFGVGDVIVIYDVFIFQVFLFDLIGNKMILFEQKFIMFLKLCGKS